MLSSRSFHARALAAVPAALILLLGSGALLAIRQERRDAAGVARSHDVIATSRGVLARLLGVESAVRAFVITGRPEHVERYHGLRREVDSMLVSLRGTLRAAGADAARVDAIEALTRSRYRVLEAQVTAASERPLRPAGELDPGTETLVALTTTGNQLSDSVQRLIAGLDDAASRLRRVRVAASERRTRLGLLLVGLGMGGAVVLSLVTSTLLIGTLRRESRATVRLAKKIAELGEKNSQLIERETELEAQASQLSDQAVELELQTQHLAQQAKELDEQTELLRESEQRYRAILEAISDGAILHASDGSVVTINRSAERILGMDAAAMSNGADTRRWRFVREDGSELRREELPHRRALATGQQQPGELLCVERPDRDPLWLYVTCMPVALRTGTGVVTTISDVTSLRQAQSQLERERRFFDAILESIDEAVIACDANGRLNFFNRAARALSGVPADEREPDEWAARYSFTRVDGKQMRLEELPLYRALHGEIVDNVEMTLVPPDRAPIRVVAAARPLAGDERLGAVVVLRNVTATRLAEQQLHEADERLRQVQKMEAVGQLAGGVAHDFNNLLTAITSYAELARESLPADGAASADISEILAAAERARVLTRQLLAFSRRQSFELRPMDVNASVRRAEGLLRRLLPASIELTVRRTPDPLVVESDPVQFEQVLINLAVNARDAISGHGTIVIETSEFQLDADTSSQIPELAPGGYALLSVSDDGAGMDADLQKRIFEPFFTTKPAGHGTGLGLSTVYGIVRQSRGTILVNSESGVGTTFRVYLPIADAFLPASTSPAQNPEVYGDETVLVVDDEAQVRTAVKRVLETRGFTVIDAADGQEAVHLAERQNGSLDLLISDLVMPGMGGRELADKLRATRPDLPVVFISGYMAGTMGRLDVDHAQTRFVQKPFSTATLLAAVGAALKG